MLDHHEIRMWADHRASVVAWLANLRDQTRQAFDVLVAIQYAEPWKATAVRPATPGSTARCEAPEGCCPQ